MSLWNKPGVLVFNYKELAFDELDMTNSSDAIHEFFEMWKSGYIAIASDLRVDLLAACDIINVKQEDKIASDGILIIPPCLLEQLAKEKQENKTRERTVAAARQCIETLIGSSEIIYDDRKTHYFDREYQYYPLRTVYGPAYIGPYLKDIEISKYSIWNTIRDVARYTVITLFDTLIEKKPRVEDPYRPTFFDANDYHDSVRNFWKSFSMLDEKVIEDIIEIYDSENMLFKNTRYEHTSFRVARNSLHPDLIPIYDAAMMLAKEVCITCAFLYSINNDANNSLPMNEEKIDIVRYETFSDSEAFSIALKDIKQSYGSDLAIQVQAIHKAPFTDIMKTYPVLQLPLFDDANK